MKISPKCISNWLVVHHGNVMSCVWVEVLGISIGTISAEFARLNVMNGVQCMCAKLINIYLCAWFL